MPHLDEEDSEEGDGAVDEENDAHASVLVLGGPIRGVGCEHGLEAVGLQPEIGHHIGLVIASDHKHPPNQ